LFLSRFFDGAKVRAPQPLHNPTRVVFSIPQPWYKADSSPILPPEHASFSPFHTPSALKTGRLLQANTPSAPKTRRLLQSNTPSGSKRRHVLHCSGVRGEKGGLFFTVPSCAAKKAARFSLFRAAR